MRTDPITKETFEPKTPNQHFASKEAFSQFIDELDPMDEFKPVKREINWAPRIRKDPITGEEFTAKHPAQKHAPKKEE